MSSNRSTGKHQPDKVRKGDSDSRVPSSLHHSHRTTEGRYTGPQRIKQERPLTPNDRYTDPDRSKSSRPLHAESAEQRRLRAARNGRSNFDEKDDQHRRTTLIAEKGGGAERSGKPGDASLASDGEEAGTRSASLKRKNEKKTKGQRIGRVVDSSPQPYVLESDLRVGNNYYLYCLGKIYDVTDMRRRMELHYWNLLARQRQLGFHSQKECEVYMRYLSRPRTAKYGTTYSGQQRTKSTEGRRKRGESEGRARTASTTDGKRKTVAAEDDKDQKESCGDNKGRPVSSKSRAVSSKSRAVDLEIGPTSSKPRAAISKPRSNDSETRPTSSRPRAASSKLRMDSPKEVRREADHQRKVSRSEEEEGDEEIDRRRSNENNEDKREHSGNSPSGNDQRDTGTERQSSVVLPSEAADAGTDCDWTDTSSSDESETKSNIVHSGDGESKEAVGVAKRDRRNTQEKSSDDGNGDSD